MRRSEVATTLLEGCDAAAGEGFELVEIDDHARFWLCDLQRKRERSQVVPEGDDRRGFEAAHRIDEPVVKHRGQARALRIVPVTNAVEQAGRAPNAVVARPGAVVCPVAAGSGRRPMFRDRHHTKVYAVMSSQRSDQPVGSHRQPRAGARGRDGA